MGKYNAMNLGKLYNPNAAVSLSKGTALPVPRNPRGRNFKEHIAANNDIYFGAKANTGLNSNANLNTSYSFHQESKRYTNKFMD